MEQTAKRRQFSLESNSVLANRRLPTIFTEIHFSSEKEKKKIFFD
jgi:hypothetical protein